MKIRCFFLAALVSFTLLLSACGRGAGPPTVTPPSEPQETAIAEDSATVVASPAPEGQKGLNVCLVGEPDTLYLYGGSQVPATHDVMEALYDGPIDHRNYAYQAVILDKLPTWSDGDVVTRTAVVREGDRVVDAGGEPVELQEGTRVRPSGCTAPGCEVVFDGGVLQMDQLEVTFRLRQDVTWSDGVPLTAQDSVFGFCVASDPATPGYRPLTERTASYRAGDRWHTTWVGVPGYLDRVYASVFFPPLPRHQLAEYSASALVGHEKTRRDPLGWGPFVMEEWVQGDHITVVRNLQYFRAAEGLPRVDKVVFKVRADKEAVVAGVLSGSCDIGTHHAGFGPLLPLLTRLDAENLLRVVSAPSSAMTMLSFNTRSAGAPGRPGFFAEPRVRRAVAHCVDRQALVDEMTHGLSVAPDSYVPPAHPLYPEGELSRWDYDPVQGRALLDEVGWRDLNNDGVREAQGVEGVFKGQPLEVKLLALGDGEWSQEMARILRAQLADCGVRVGIEALPRWELTADDSEAPLSDRAFDLLAATWQVGDTPWCSVSPTLETSNRQAWNGVTVTGYSSADYAAACRSAREALRSTQRYEQSHREAQIIFSEDLPALPLYVELRTALARPEVEDFGVDATSESDLWRLESLDVEGGTEAP